jgi:hypothetical protein
LSRGGARCAVAKRPASAIGGSGHRAENYRRRARRGQSREKAEKESHGEFESENPGYCSAQDTFYVDNLVGRIYQQTFVETYAKVASAKLYDRKTSGRFAQ